MISSLHAAATIQSCRGTSSEPDLTEVRRLIANGRTELNRRTGDRADHWLDSARHRLGDLDLILVRSTARLNGWVRTAIAAVILFAGVLTAAAGAQAIGLPGGGVIAVAVLTMIFLPPRSHYLIGKLEQSLERRRARPAWPVAVVPTGDGLTEVPEQLLLARTRLVAGTAPLGSGVPGRSPANRPRPNSTQPGPG